MLLKRALFRLAATAMPMRLNYNFSKRAKNAQLILHSPEHIEQMLIRK